MKKNILTALVAAGLMMTSNAHAQQGFSLSLKALPQFSFLQNSDDNDNTALSKKATFNAAFGLGAGYNFTGNMGIGLDVLYSLQGQRYELRGVEMNQKLNYVKIPVFFAYSTDASKPVSFLAKAGPQLSLRTGAKVTDTDGNELVSDKKSAFESATVGGLVGAGVQFRLNKTLFLTTTARLDYDFTNADDNSYSSTAATRATTHNMTTGLEVGLRYTLH